MANVLIYTEKAKLAAELVTAAKAIDDSVAAATVNDDALAAEVAAFGVDVYAVNNSDLALGDTAAMAAAIAQVAEAAGADTVLLASNRRGKELAGRLAAQMSAGVATDCGSVAVKDGKIVATRNNFGGATIAETVVATDKKVFSISPKSFVAAEAGAAGAVNAVDVTVTPSVKAVTPKAKESENVDISAADTLVCVGCGFDTADQIADAEKVAAALENAMVACSKPVATDRKWMAEARIVGISGTICKPDLAITLGVSGQVQFNVGVRDSKTIVAIDKDENAPIFQFADYGLVGDLADVLPELAGALA